MKYKFTDYLKETLKNDLKRVMNEDLVDIDGNVYPGSVLPTPVPKPGGKKGVTPIDPNSDGTLPVDPDEVDDPENYDDLDAVPGPPDGWYTDGEGGYWHDGNGNGIIDDADWHFSDVTSWEIYYVNGEAHFRVEFNGGIGGYIDISGNLHLNAESLIIMGLPSPGNYLVQPNGIILHYADHNGDGTNTWEQWSAPKDTVPGNVTELDDDPNWLDDPLQAFLDAPLWLQALIIAGLIFAGWEVYNYLNSDDGTPATDTGDGGFNDGETDDNTGDGTDPVDDGGGWG